MDQAKSELRELLGNKDTMPEQIKAGLTALRLANEKARQDLRQLMTVRQEATLVRQRYDESICLLARR